MKPECENCAEYASEFCKDCLDEKEMENKHFNCGTPDCCGECETADIIEAVNAPKWKRAGPNGELEIKFSSGRRFKVEKQLDHNERHKGEWKVMEYKPGGVDNWEWVDTYSPKGFAKQKAMMLGQYDKRGKKVADYSKTFQYESVMHEEAEGAPAVNTTSIPNPAKTAMGPRFKAQNVTDRRRKKGKTVLLKRFRKYMEDNG